jgi:hypothetical protein
MSFRILIACLKNWDSCAEIPFLLNEAGCKVDVFCSSKSWLISNNYFNHWYESPEHLDEYRNQLIKLVKNEDFDWVILADDALIRYMNEVVESDMFAKIMPIQDIGQRSMLSSKKGFSEFCRNNGIDTPGFVIYNGREDLKAIKETLNFPVINKLDFSWGGADMSISHTFEELEANLHRIPPNENVLIQEFIEGEEICVESLFYNSELMTYFTSIALQYSTTRFSFTTKRRYFNDTKLEQILRKIGKSARINSFVNISFIHDKKSNKYFLIEADTRPNSWMAYSRFVGKHHFTQAVKNIIRGNIINNFKGMDMKETNIEVSLFYKQLWTALWQKDLKTLFNWLFNFRGNWKYIPLYDKKLMRRIINEIWDKIFLYSLKKKLRFKLNDD